MHLRDMATRNPQNAAGQLLGDDRRPSGAERFSCGESRVHRVERTARTCSWADSQKLQKSLRIVHQSIEQVPMLGKLQLAPRVIGCRSAARLLSAKPSPSAIAHIREVEGVPPPGAFSRATVHNGLVYVSGTGASNDTATGEVRGGTAFEETRGALENVETILRAAGSAPEHIVVATMLLTNKEDYAECNRAYVDYFAEHGLAERLPARSSALWAVPTSAKVAFSVVAALAPA